MKSFSSRGRQEIAAGRLPRMNFVLVGVGDDVDEEQLEDIAHAEYQGRRPPVVPPHREGDQPGRRAGGGARRRDDDGGRGRHHLRRQGQGAEDVRGPPARGARVRRATRARRASRSRSTASATPSRCRTKSTTTRTRITTDGWPRSRRSSRSPTSTARGTRSSPRCCTIPTVEGLDVALYMDGSASMEDEYGPRGILAKLAPGEEPGRAADAVDARVPAPTRTATASCAWPTGRPATAASSRWWATSRASRPRTTGSPARRFYGKATVMLPVLRDFVAHIKQQVPRRAPSAGWR